MSKQTINIGASPNDGTGTPLRTSFDYTNQNFTELYTAVGPSGNNIVVPGSATITGDLTVDTSTLKVDSANDRVGIGTASPAAGAKLSVLGTTVVSASDFPNASTWSARFQAAANSQPSGIFLSGLASGGQVVPGSLHVEPVAASSRSALIATYSADSGVGYFAINRFSPSDGATYQHYKIADDGVATWSNVGGVAGTAMTLNSTGLGVGVASPAQRLHVKLDQNAYTYSRIDNQNASSGAYAALMLSASGNSWGIGVGSTAANSNALDFFLDAGGANSLKMRLDSSGNVGIGVTPSAWATYKAVSVGGIGASVFGLGSSQGGLVQGAYYSNLSGSGWAYTATSQVPAYYLQINGEHRFHNAISGTAGAQITAWTQAMTLDASGNLLVGTMSVINSARVSLKAASVATVLSLNGVTGDTAQESFVINKFDSNSTTSQVFARFTNGNGASGSGQINGNGANACAFGSFSDSRLKENILSLPSQLANILSLRPVEFDYKDGSGHQIGFVAQEMQEVYSDAVGEQNGFLTVTGWSKTEARLVSAIKELAAKVQALEAKLA